MVAESKTRPMTNELRTFIDKSKNTRNTIKWVKERDPKAKIYGSEERIESELAGILIDSDVISAYDLLNMQEHFPVENDCSWGWPWPSVYKITNAGSKPKYDITDYEV